MQPKEKDILLLGLHSCLVSPKFARDLFPRTLGKVHCCQAATADFFRYWTSMRCGWVDLHGARARATWFCFRAFLQDLLGVFFIFLVLLSKTKARGTRLNPIGESNASPRVCQQASDNARDARYPSAKNKLRNREGAWGPQWAKPHNPYKQANASSCSRSNTEANARLRLSCRQCLREEGQGSKHWHCLSPCPQRDVISYSGLQRPACEKRRQWQKALTLFPFTRQKGIESVGLDDAGS